MGVTIPALIQPGSIDHVPFPLVLGHLWLYERKPAIKKMWYSFSFGSWNHMILLMSSLNFVNVFKMKKKYELLQSEVTMEENLKTISFNFYVKRMVFFTIFQLLEQLNKMG